MAAMGLATMPANPNDFNQFIRTVVIEQIGEEHLVNVSNLKAFFPGYEQIKVAFEVFWSELQSLMSQLDQSFPKLIELVAQADAAGQTLATSISGLENSDREISDR